MLRVVYQRVVSHKPAQASLCKPMLGTGCPHKPAQALRTSSPHKPPHKQHRQLLV